jgi:hypothetical protein
MMEIAELRQAHTTWYRRYVGFWRTEKVAEVMLAHSAWYVGSRRIVKTEYLRLAHSTWFVGLGEQGK